MEDFVHLHVHTYYSILDGQSPIKRLVDKAMANGMKGMAITDHGDMFGIKEFFDICNSTNKKLKEEGRPPFKPIFGCEMYVAHRRMEDRDKDRGDNSGYHLIVLAKNYQGYKNLIKLVSRSWTDGYYYRPRTDRADLERHHEGLIVCSACIAGEVPHKILNGDMAGAREAVEWYHRVFGDDYYLELQRHEVKDPTVRANRETFPLQQKANRVLMELAREYGIKVVCTNDCHFVDQENAEAHDHLLCLSTGKELDDPSRMLYSKQEWMKTREEMNEVFADVPEALSNTIEILNKVETYDIEHAPIMPFFPIPADFGTEDDYRRRISPEELFLEFTSDENGQNPLPREEGEAKVNKLGGIDKLYRIKFEADYLGKLAYEGARRLYGEPLSQEVDDRIRFELHIMKTMGFPGYFLIVQDFINSAQKELGVMVGPGRGSAAGSVVAYCLGITKIDPIKYDLLFERFLNPDRISLPDIDTDFDDDGRGRVLEWVEDKYGHDNCAHIITYGTMATKNSIKDVARVEKVPLDVVNRLCKAIPDRLPEGAKMNLTNAIKYVPELREAEASPDERLRNTMKYAKMLEGTVRGTGIHACGFIICRDPISDWVPVSVVEDKDDKGHKLHCTQYDGHVIESTGLIKMDFLGLKTLSILKEAVENIRLTTGKVIDLDTIPIDDPLTYELYQKGNTIGTFQFESAGMQKYLRELHPTVFEDLIAMNALYRPGPHGLHPRLCRPQAGHQTHRVRPARDGGVPEGHLRHHGLSGAGDASFKAAGRLHPRPERLAQKGHGKEENCRDGEAGGALLPGRREQRLRQDGAQQDLGGLEEICQLRLQQEPRHLLFVGGLSDGLPQGPLPGGIHGRRDEPQLQQHHRGDEAHGRMSLDGHSHPGSRHQREPAEVLGQQEGRDTLRPGRHQGHGLGGRRRHY